MTRRARDLRRRIHPALLELLPYLLADAQARLRAALKEEMDEEGLQWSELALLIVLTQLQEASPTVLVERTGIDRTTVGDLLERLYDDGLVRVRRHERDGRRLVVEPTPTAASAVAGGLEAVGAAERRAFAPPVMEPLRALLRRASAT